MLENVMAACHSILVPARILEHPNKVPAVHGGYNTYQYGHSQHYTYRDHDVELPSNSLFRGLADCFWSQSAKLQKPWKLSNVRRTQN
jgi:hypothetical protein